LKYVKQKVSQDWNCEAVTIRQVNKEIARWNYVEMEEEISAKNFEK
jgi:ribosomal protein L29